MNIYTYSVAQRSHARPPLNVPDNAHFKSYNKPKAKHGIKTCRGCKINSSLILYQKLQTPATGWMPWGRITFWSSCATKSTPVLSMLCILPSTKEFYPCIERKVQSNYLQSLDSFLSQNDCPLTIHIQSNNLDKRSVLTTKELRKQGNKLRTALDWWVNIQRTQLLQMISWI